MITYLDLVSRIETIRVEPDSFAMAHILGEISEEEDAVRQGNTFGHRRSKGQRHAAWSGLLPV